MPMQIQDEPDLSCFAYLVQVVFNGCNFRTIVIFLGAVPFSVQIFTSEVGSVVAENDPIHVHHRNYIKHKVLQQKISLSRFR